MKNNYQKLENELTDNSWLETNGETQLVIHFKDSGDINRPIIVTDQKIIRRLAVELKAIARKEMALSE